MKRNNIKTADLWRLNKLLQLLDEALGDEPEGWVTQKDLQKQEEVRLLIPSSVHGPCWLGQAMRCCGITKVRMRNGIRYTITRQAIVEALEGIRAARAQQAKAVNGIGKGDIETTGPEGN